MTSAFRRALLTTTGVLLLGWIVSGCSGGSSGAAGSADQSAAVNVQTGSMFVTVENRAGQPLLDIHVAIKPVGGSTLFITTTVPRLEHAEKRDLSLGDFSGRDGTPFNLRVVRPKEVIVTAVDLVGKKYEVTVPWKG